MPALNPPAETSLAEQTHTPTSDPDQEFSILHANFAVPASLQLPAADVPFEIDCSSIDPSRMPECLAYLNNTRDVIYPFYRLLTDVSLSICYDAVYYRIVPDEQYTERQGEADDNHITYNLRSTLDMNVAPLYDAHEILHVIGFCNEALDQHIFHGAFESHIDITLTGVPYQWPDREHMVNWLETRLVPDLGSLGSSNETPTPGPNQGNYGADLFNSCTEIYGSLVTILYYDTGIENIKQVYHDTIQPGANITPNAVLVGIFGDATARKVQVVVNAIRNNPVYQIAVPRCGID